jgi:NAD(P)-dependent dehydrogenase (short-subunit alcohol dehydrogenase family)
MSMRGKVVVITGSNVGIGLETAVGVASLEATTILACRNRAKAEAAAKEVTRRTWNDDVHVVDLDLADLASVGKAADDVLERWDRLDVLVNNAGGTWSARQVTAQGFEYTFGVNHLGHFALTNALLQRLKDSAPSRIVCVTSVGHHFAPDGMHFEDLQSERRYEGMEVYCRSKLANVLFVRELARRLNGARVTANAAHPGWVRSSFGMDGDTTGVTGFGMHVIRPFQIGPRRGAKTSVYLATSPDVAGRSGLYWVRSKPGHMSRRAKDEPAAARLWHESENLLASAGFPAPGT